MDAERNVPTGERTYALYPRGSVFHICRGKVGPTLCGTPTDGTHPQGPRKQMVMFVSMWRKVPALVQRRPTTRPCCTKCQRIDKLQRDE